MSFLPLICSSLPSLRQLGPAAHLTSMWASHVNSVSYLQHQSHCRSRTDGAGLVMAFCPWRAPSSGLGRGPSRLAGSPRQPTAVVPELTHGQATHATGAELAAGRPHRLQLGLSTPWPGHLHRQAKLAGQGSGRPPLAS